MLNRFTLAVVLGTLLLGLAACGELSSPPKPAEEPVADTPKATPAPEGPYYEITKEDLTGHPDFTSKNVKILGVKIGDSTKDMEKALGNATKPPAILDKEYLAFYQDNSLGMYTFKMTGKVNRMEIYKSFSGRIADPKPKALLDSGDLKQMRAIFGMEETMIDKPDEMGTEYVYDARGIRFIKYKTGINGLRFGDITK